MIRTFLHAIALSLLIGTSLQAATNSSAATNPPAAQSKAAAASENSTPKNMVGLRIPDPDGIKIEWDVAYLPTNRNRARPKLSLRKTS